MRKVTQEGVDLIKHFEGFSAKPYLCAAGYPTIGYGHLMQGLNPSALKDGTLPTLTRGEAEEILRKDLRSAEASVLRLTHRPLADNQFNALVSFVFNLGGGAYQASTLRRKVNAGLDDEVPGQFLRWCYAGGRKLPGLLRRRQAEASMYAEA